MEIYVQSRSQQRDYYWLAKKENQPEEEILPPIVKTANQLIDDQVFSVVLWRSQDKKLLLLVTALKTRRQDSKGRNIRNSVAWIGEKKDEPILRKIAVMALQNQLEQKIDDVVVDSNNSSGFQVKWDAIQSLILASGVASELSLTGVEAKGKIARISESFKQDLAETLTKYNLPEREGALVVVTSRKAKETLESAKVWRGLSDDPRIAQKWEDLSSGGTTPTPSLPSPNQSISTPVKLAIVAAVLVILTFGAYLVAQNLGSRVVNPIPPPSQGCQYVSKKPLDLSKEKNKQIIKNLKVFLREANFYKGKTEYDEKYGQDTQKALDKFIANNKPQPTGTQATWEDFNKATIEWQNKKPDQKTNLSPQDKEQKVKQLWEKLCEPKTGLSSAR